MSHIAIKLNGVYLATGEDTAIDIEDANPYFNDQSETMSLPFTVPLDGNREAFGNVECIENDDNLRSIEGKRMDVEVDGILLRSGKAGSIEDQELTDSVALQMVSAVYSLDDYLDGVRCRDVDLIDEIPIGETIGNVTFNFSCRLQVIMKTYGFHLKNGHKLPFEKNHVIDSYDEPPHFDSLVVSLPAVGFSQPGICVTKGGSSGFGSGSPFDSDGSVGKPATMSKSFINVTDMYMENGAKYCNARVCYMNYKEKDGETTDEVDADNPYMVLEANRPGSGICFYVLYFLDCLFAMFKEDGIAYDNSELMKIEDMRRLAFFTTHCKFRTEPQTSPTSPSPLLRNIDQINSWLQTRNIDTKLTVDDSEREQVISSIKIDGVEYKQGSVSPFYELGIGEIWWQNVLALYYKYSDLAYSVTADPMTMYATSQNFPDSDAKTIIDSLWSSFGIRFFLDQQTRQVKPRFIRDILRSTEEAIVFPCKVITATKKTSKVTGFRMQYSGQSDKQTRQDNITMGVLDYDTVYDYEDYRNLTLLFDYSEIIKKDYDTNMTLYCDLSTGDLYRVKIDSEAETRSEYHPVIFEVGQLHGVEIGDCSKVNDEFIEEVTSSFQPIVFNDVNYRNERKHIETVYEMRNENGEIMRVEFETGETKKQILAAFISEKMEHEYIARSISFPAGTKQIQLNLQADIKTQEAFDDVDSPLQSLDWGLAISVMRGGGASAHIDYYDYNYDMFGNCKYRMVAGSDYGISLDSIDNYGQVYDYNGDLPGIGGGSNGDERISLKIRSYIEAPEDMVGPNGEVIPKGTPLCDPQVMNRGLFDQFMSEYAYFRMNANPIELTIQCEVAALTSIQWHRRYRFGDYVGWINKINTHITAAQGIESVTVELLVL